MKKALGGERLGSGNKMNVEMHEYGRSTHNWGHIWRSSMSCGTLVPFLCKIGLPGSTHDITLNAEVMTHPTIGPLLASYKLQLDVFLCPVRLYQGLLHNNNLGIGRNMAQVKLPQMKLQANQYAGGTNPTISQINPSCILHYLGISGVGIVRPEFVPDPPFPKRDFNATAFIAYWDIYKNYYLNKQEGHGAVIHTERQAVIESVTSVNLINGPTTNEIPQAPAEDPATTLIMSQITVIGTDPDPRPIPEQIIINTSIGKLSLVELCTPGSIINLGSFNLKGTFNYPKYGSIELISWDYITPQEAPMLPARVATFPEANLDLMRQFLLKEINNTGTPVYVNDLELPPYSWIVDGDPDTGLTNMGNTQEGLAIKTYQSDMFNNWLSEEWIEGVNGIAELTAVSTVGDKFTIDQLIIQEKVYNLLNRIAVSGGSYYDYLDAAYTAKRITQLESPIYYGSLIKELIFQEVVSNSKSESEAGTQPLGTLAGKGVMAKKHKGGRMTIKPQEHSYIIGIASLTPRIDYSQGNDFDVNLKTMDDFHKPALDAIGFQDLISEQMAWFDTTWDVVEEEWVQKSVGKQPAWINYMTAVNKTHGNFAIESNEMFMTLNRRYEYDPATAEIDFTTYIDPAKYNVIFADTSLDSQNFWVQIAIDHTARQIMSGKLMPNL